MSSPETTDPAPTRLVLHFPESPMRRRICIWGWSVWAVMLGGKVEIVAND